MTGRLVLNELARRFDPEQAVTTGTWFGKPCLQVAGKVFAAQSGDDVAFKLSPEARSEALQIEGAHLCDPRGTGRPMAEWVQIPAVHSPAWSRFAELARATVANAAQARKDGIVADLRAVRRAILEAASALPPAHQGEVFLGTWTVKELLAHLAGWDYANLEGVQAILAGQVPAFFGQRDRGWQTFNARLVAQYRVDDFEELVAVVERSQRELVDFLETVPPEAFDRDYGVRVGRYRVTVARILEGEARDERVHQSQVEAFVRRAIAS